MCGPPDKRSARPRPGSSASKEIAHGSGDGSDDKLKIPVSQLAPRPIGPGELAALRVLWWRQASTGRRLPAESGVIVIPGGAA